MKESKNSKLWVVKTKRKKKKLSNRNKKISSWKIDEK